MTMTVTLLCTLLVCPGALLIYFNDGGGGVPSDFLGSETLAQSDFFESIDERCWNFFWVTKKTRGIFWVAKKE